MRSFTSWPGWGRIHAGVRWNTVRWAAWGCTRGTICTALAPVPMTPTRLAVRSASGSHCAECTIWPWNCAMPSKLGIDGSERKPLAETSTWAWWAEAAPVATSRSSSSQACASSSQRAAVTSVPNRQWAVTPWVSATRRR